MAGVLPFRLTYLFFLLCSGLLGRSLFGGSLGGYGSGLLGDSLLGRSLLSDWLIVALALHGGDTGASGTAHKDALLKHLGSAGADVGTSLNDLVGFEFHLAAGIADMGDFAISFDIVTGIDRSLELNHIIGTEETFVAILLDEKFGGYVTKEVNHVGAINQISTIVGVLGAHADAEHRCNCHSAYFLMM